jgi:SAM-dependent methyltransferase
MLATNTDKNWEKWGKDDPYFGVLSDPKYSKDQLNAAHKEEFFRSGSTHIHRVLEKVRKHLSPTFSVANAIDFGCGVGRLVIPLSNIAEYVVGIDVSESVLDEARRNCSGRKIANVEFRKSDDALSSVSGKYNFIHSYIVFQHIPVSRGERLFERLCALLDDGGVGVVHFTYANRLSRTDNLVRWVRANVPLVQGAINLAKGRKWDYPHMQMNNYDLNRLFRHLQENNVHCYYVEHTDHGGFLGAILYFQKPGVGRNTAS